MKNKIVVPCGGLPAPRDIEGNATVCPLTLWSGKTGSHNITLRIEDLHRRFYKSLPPQFEDLLELAACVYCADQASSRGRMDVDTFGSQWRRHFEFHVPVRVPEFWNQKAVVDGLRSTLEFLSDDTFEFNFVAAERIPEQQYFQRLLVEEPLGEIEGVSMFSGGLDSLAGIVRDAVVEKRRILAVNHRPTDKLNNVHRALEAMLEEKAGNFHPAHLHVTINKRKELNREYTQRTRSFLYMALGATVARMLGLDSLRFYENGVVSMNLPVSAQVVGSRATRTTHPRAIGGFSDLLTQVAGRPFKVENPFIWNTKGEVVRMIVDAGCGELIRTSISCAHTWTYSHEHTHCGTCSQCIDRRFGVMAANAERFETADKYANDVFTGSRPKDEDRMMIAAYLERANKMASIKNAADFVAKYPDALRVLNYLPGKPMAVAERVLNLHRRHAEEVNQVVEAMLARNTTAIRKRTLPRDCLLRIVYDAAPGAVVNREANSPFQEQQKQRLVADEQCNKGFRLHKGHKAWELVFEGKREVLMHERALDLIDYLLKRPRDEPIHATELEMKVDGMPLIDLPIENGGSEALKSGIGGPLQEGTGRKFMGGTGTILKSKLAELQSAIMDETLPELERQCAREETLELLRCNARGGKFKSGATQSAERVRKAITRLISDLKDAEVRKGVPNPILRSFGEHLNKYLWQPSVGARNRSGAAGRAGCYTYEPPAGIVWKD